MPITDRFAALSNDPVAEEAAQDYLLAGGSALGGVLSGFFAAAGGHAGVLLSPMSLLVGGVGAGVRAFDGRVRQPGVGAKRPRGFTAKESIPDAARVAVPTAVAAALVALAYDGTQKLGSVLKAGIQRAQRGGAPERAALLRRIRSVGAGAMSELSFVRAVLRVAGPSEGGLLTAGDFGSIGDVDHPASERVVGGATVLEVPWAQDDRGLPGGSDIGLGCCVLAADVRGLFAGMAYRRVTHGFVIEDVELEAPLSAVPVQRGVARSAPGTQLPAPAPLAMRRDGEGNVVEMVACPLSSRLDEQAWRAPALRLMRDPIRQIVEATRA